MKLAPAMAVRLAMDLLNNIARIPMGGAAIRDDVTMGGNSAV